MRERGFHNGSSVSKCSLPWPTHITSPALLPPSFAPHLFLELLGGLVAEEELDPVPAPGALRLDHHGLLLGGQPVLQAGGNTVQGEEGRVSKKRPGRNEAVGSSCLSPSRPPESRPTDLDARHQRVPVVRPLVVDLSGHAAKPLPLAASPEELVVQLVRNALVGPSLEAHVETHEFSQVDLCTREGGGQEEEGVGGAKLREASPGLRSEGTCSPSLHPPQRMPALSLLRTLWWNWCRMLRTKRSLMAACTCRPNSSSFPAASTVRCLRNCFM